MLSGNFSRSEIAKFNAADDEEITVSKRFKNMHLASTKTGNLTSEEQEHKDAFSFFNEIKNKLPKILTKGLNQSYIASMYNTKISGDFENERVQAIKEYNKFLREKRQKIADNALSYDNFFNVFVLDYETVWQPKTHTWFASSEGKGEARKFIRKTDMHGNKVWKESFINSSAVRPAYIERHPTSVFLDELLAGNANNAGDFPVPIFHNDKFSHFTDTLGKKKLYENGEQDHQYKKIAEFLNSKGFKVRTKIALFGNTLGVCYNRQDMILGCWNSSPKEYKIENLKYSVSSSINDMMVTFSDFYAAKNRSDDAYIDHCEKHIMGSHQKKVYEYCNLLKTLYINETDLEIKTLIEASIFSVREMFKREYAEYAKTTNDFNKKVKDTLRYTRTIKEFHIQHNAILNDDLYPQGILKATNKMNELKLNVTRHVAKSIGLHATYSYDAKTKIIADRSKRMLAEYSTLVKSKNKADRAKAEELREHIVVFNYDALNTMSDIYTNPTTNADGTKTADVRVTEGSTPSIINSLIQRRKNGDESTYSQNAEDLRRVQEGEGIQNDNNVELNELSREQCNLIHKQNTGREMESSKVEFADVPLDSQQAVNPGYTIADGQADKVVEDRIEQERLTYLRSERDRLAAEAQELRQAQQRAAMAARRAANRPAFINKIIDFFAN